MAADDPIDALFALPPEEFTAARDALAKRLKAEGDAEAATAARRLRRPSVPAWAVNQLARTAPEDLQRLLATGDLLRRAQRAALSGAGGRRLRDATAQRRALLGELTDRAAHILADADRNPDPHRAAIAATLEAATVDEDAADLVRAGRLPRELPPPSGFGDLTGLALVPDLDDEDEASAPPAEGSEGDGTPKAAERTPKEPQPTRAGAAVAEGPQADDGARGETGARAAQDGDAQADGEARAEAGAQETEAETERAAEAAARAAAEAEAERETRAAAEAARTRADEAEEVAGAAEAEATRARERADVAVEAVRDLERQLAEARREREATERAAVDAESSAYRARRAAKRARAASG